MAVTETHEDHDRYYIHAGPALPDARTLVLKHDQTFGIFNSWGDIDHSGNEVHGLFADGMRYLSRLGVRVNGAGLLLLSSKVTNDNTRIIADLTNPDIMDDGRIVLPRGTLHVTRSLFIWSNTFFERLVLANYGLAPVHAHLSLVFESDFADIFEVRGTPRDARAPTHPPQIADGSLVLSQTGLDGVTRRAVIQFEPPPRTMSESEVDFAVTLAPRARRRFEFSVLCEPTTALREASYDEGASRLLMEVEADQGRYCRVLSSSERLYRWVQRSVADTRTLVTATAHGPYPFAGIPWFSTPFGRDGIITALELLWVNSDVARGVLTFLAATQSRDLQPERDAEPGKILHEWRTDEMANTGEVPFGRYYGSVDATPLFIMLAGAYYEHTADAAFIESIWPNIQLALRWIDEFGDVDGDGFVEYQRRSHDGLENQGWKDSHDSIFHADGSLARGAIALCEVQAYVYDAKMRAAAMARRLGHGHLADDLFVQASRLKQRFNEAFWRSDLGMYALALDGRKQACSVRTSNAGHALFCGIADEQHARQMRSRMFSEEMYSGWGVRTVAANEARYNPMAYHNGSIWPHDNALIAAGFSRYGYRESALRIFRGWLSASNYLDLHRLPELCCGFQRRRGKGPTLYPSACSPQAWAAGAAFMMLAACLGITVDGLQRQVRIDQPRLPRSIRELTIRNLRVADASLDLLFHQNRRDVGVLVLRKAGQVDIVVTK